MNIAVRELTRNCGSSSKSLVHSINFLTNKLSLDFCKKKTNFIYCIFRAFRLHNKDDSSIPLFKRLKTIEREQIRVSNKNRKKRIKYQTKTTQQQTH